MKGSGEANCTFIFELNKKGHLQASDPKNYMELINLWVFFTLIEDTSPQF